MSLISELIKIMKMWHFCKFYHFLIVIKSTPGQISKIHTITFRILRQKCVLLPENSLWPASKYPQIKTSFVIGSLCLLSKCQVEITEFKHRHEHGINFCSYDINLSLHQCEPFLFFWLMESSN